MRLWNPASRVHRAIYPSFFLAIGVQSRMRMAAILALFTDCFELVVWVSSNRTIFSLNGVQLRWAKYFVVLRDRRPDRVMDAEGQVVFANPYRSWAQKVKGVGTSFGPCGVRLAGRCLVGLGQAVKAKKCDNYERSARARLGCHDGRWCETALRWRMNSVELMMWSLSGVFLVSRLTVGWFGFFWHYVNVHFQGSLLRGMRL